MNNNKFIEYLESKFTSEFKNYFELKKIYTTSELLNKSYSEAFSLLNVVEMQDLTDLIIVYAIKSSFILENSPEKVLVQLDEKARKFYNLYKDKYAVNNLIMCHIYLGSMRDSSYENFCKEVKNSLYS